MGNDIAVVSAAAITTTGTQDFKVPKADLNNAAPIAALFFMTYGLTDGTVVNDTLVAQGMTDGTRQIAVAARSQDNAAAGQAGCNERTDALLVSVAPGSGSSPPITAKAVFDSWINDGTDMGIRINWTDAPEGAYLIKCILFGASGFSNAYGNDFFTSGVLNTAQTFEDAGFAPDLVFILNHQSSINNNSQTFFGATFGFAINDGASPPSQGSINTYDGGTNPSNVQHTISDRSVQRLAVSGGGAAEAEINDFSATGFKVYQRVAATGMDGVYLALKFNTSAALAAKVVSSTSPTAGGSHSITGAGWTPQFGLAVLSASQTMNAAESSGDAEVWGVGMFTPLTQACVGVAIDDAVTPTNNESLTDAKPVSLRKDAGAFMTATFTAMNTDGVEFNYTTANGTARQRRVLFIKEGITGGPARPRQQQIPGMQYTRGGF